MYKFKPIKMGLITKYLKMLYIYTNSHYEKNSFNYLEMVHSTNQSRVDDRRAEICSNFRHYCQSTLRWSLGILKVIFVQRPRKVVFQEEGGKG